jgi:HSP20 family protein
MSALTPFERFDDMFPDFFRRWAAPAQFGAGMPKDIRIDVSENDKEYLVSAEIPGARKDDVRVVVDGNYVSISAEVKKDLEDKHGKNGRVLVRETCRGTISRGFTLAHEVDDKGAAAKFEDGILRLTLPKRIGTSSKLLNIQ